MQSADGIRHLIQHGRRGEALASARALAQSGDADGDILVGWMYHSAFGVSQDLNEAERSYLKAAKSGSPLGMFYLGSLYATKGDRARAVEWFKRASEHNFAPATYHLGRMYLVGQGVEANRRRALECFEIAARQGHLFAKRNIAHEMIKGRQGIFRIPLGVIRLLHLTFMLLKTGLQEPHSERVLRL